MKCLLKGIVGALIVLGLAAVTVPQYSDYRARVETNVWLVQLESVQNAIEANFITKKTFPGIARNLPKPAFSPNNVTFFEVTDAGAIVTKGGNDGQMIILLPTLSGEKIIWNCIGAPNKDVPSKCRSKG